MYSACHSTQPKAAAPQAAAQDGFTYQMGSIMDWLRVNDTSPLTGLRLLHRRILRLSSLKTIFEGFLSACWSQREAGRSQRQAEARAACILEGQDDQLIDELRRLDSYIKEGRVEVEKWKDFALQSARNMSS